MMRTGKRTTFLLFPQVIFCLFVFVNVCQRTVKAQSLPPAKYDGFLYTNHLVDSDAIKIEAFFDPVCPDSRDSWPPLKRAIQYYGSRVSLIVHLLPLPLLERFFEHQETFYNAQTSNKSKEAVVNEIIKFTAEVIGSSYSVIESGFNDRKTDLKTRVSFKYSASRGVFGTPSFYVNGFALPDSGSPIDYNGWRSVIDPLIVA
ncbi:hypothetical protein PTKIN_Ptkin09bG0102700 [Pterospermum kingtungense]